MDDDDVRRVEPEPDDWPPRDDSDAPPDVRVRSIDYAEQDRRAATKRLRAMKMTPFSRMR